MSEITQHDHSINRVGSSNPNHSGLRLTGRGRLVAGVAIAAAVFGGVQVGEMAVSAFSDWVNVTCEGTTRHYVKSGDTEWDIASKINPEYTGAIVLKIDQLNPELTGDLMPGMKIVVPEHCE